MITAVSFNPCIDKTVSLEHFDLHSANRVRPLRADIGGKGVNVAVALANLGAPVGLVGFDFLQSGAMLSSMLTQNKVPHKLIPVWGALRTNLKILDLSADHTIEINELGAPVTGQDISRLRDAVLSFAEKSDFVILSGSLPQGAQSSLYRELCGEIHARNKACRVAVDCDGTSLKEALRARPELIKPNAQEFARLVGHEPGDDQSIVADCRQVIADTGISMICLSRGALGACLVTKEEAWKCPALRVPVRGVYGAGDAMLSAVCVALTEGKSLPDCLAYGIAAAAASIQLEGTQMGTKESFDRLLPRTAPCPIGEA